MTVTIVTEGHTYIVTDPEEIRIEAESITFEASVEDGRQVYIYTTQQSTQED